VGADASHAWVALWLPDLRQPGAGLWVDLDPTNNRWGLGAPGEDYITLAWGRDFSDVSPLRGVIRGGASHELEVAVTVQPLEPASGAGPPSQTT
jgi:transglutaminase-like putative cysteine protease